jgi:hypothetical protein
VQVVLLRVGIDTGSGGILGPLFKDGSFEYIPIPDCFRGEGVDGRTYGNTLGRQGRLLIDYFPEARRERLFSQCIHFDPEFRTFTYGDPTRPKTSLTRLTKGSLLVFYGGLEGWDLECPPALYIIGYFEVGCAGLANSFTRTGLRRLFRANFHVMHRKVFDSQKDRLALIKGGEGSRLLTRAVRISSLGRDRGGHPIHELSKTMQKVFGDFGGHTSIQRSPPRWVAPAFIERAAKFVRSLK